MVDILVLIKRTPGGPPSGKCVRGHIPNSRTKFHSDSAHIKCPLTSALDSRVRAGEF